MAPDPREAALSAVEVFCDSRVPEEHRDQVQLECSRRGNSITIFERRPPWNPELMGLEWTRMRVAQLRYDRSSGCWSLFCCDRNERWWPYDDIAPSASVDPLLAEIDADPTGICATEWVALLADPGRQGRLDQQLDRLQRFPLLVVDEVGYIPFDPEAANLMFMLVSRRYERASMIVTSKNHSQPGARSSATRSSQRR